MTNRDYERIAHVLDANHADISIVADFADMLGEDNPRFNRAEFIDAATINMVDGHKRFDRFMELVKAPRGVR